MYCLIPYVDSCYTFTMMIIYTFYQVFRVAASLYSVAVRQPVDHQYFITISVSFSLSFILTAPLIVLIEKKDFLLVWSVCPQWIALIVN